MSELNVEGRSVGRLSVRDGVLGFWPEEDLPLEHKGAAEPLQIAGEKFRRILTDGEILACWSFAWTPEVTGNVSHKGYELKTTPDLVGDPEYMSIFNLALTKFIDTFSRHPEEVLQLLGKFRAHIRHRGASPETGEDSAVNSGFLARGTGKEAAHFAAELAKVKTEAGVERIERRLRKKAMLVKGKPFGWPWIGSGSVKSKPVKDKKRSS